MGLESYKKSATVLVLILVIITSFSVFIAGALKVLTALDSEYSINRNSSSGSSGRISGKFLCYKKSDGNLYQQRAEYNVDGSVKSVLAETKMGDECKFNIPKGTKNFEVTVIGGGGAGAESESKYGYVSSADTDECIQEANNFINKNHIKTNNFHCVHNKPIYSLKIGSAGNAGEVNTVNINNSIYGINGSDEIKIHKNNIGNGGEAGSSFGNGGDTNFSYWYKNSNGYTNLTITAKGGNKGSQTSQTITSESEIETIESKEGVLPSSFELPSVFNIKDSMSAGFYSSQNSQPIPINATFFGASGASGYIDNLKISKIRCECIEIMTDKAYTITQPKCNDDSSNIKGTNGAPGAIMISW